MAKKRAANKTNGFEQNLWDTANKLRGSVESSEYKHVVLSLIFLKFARMMLSFESYIEAMGEGSTGQTELSRKNLAEVRVIVPPQTIQNIVEEYFYYFSQNVVGLRLTRDTLLPKLLSGELRIPEAEKMVEGLP